VKDVVYAELSGIKNMIGKMIVKNARFVDMKGMTHTIGMDANVQNANK
jgi:hypothetical protein